MLATACVLKSAKNSSSKLERSCDPRREKTVVELNFIMIHPPFLHTTRRPFGFLPCAAPILSTQCTHQAIAPLQRLEFLNDKTTMGAVSCANLDLIVGLKGFAVNARYLFYAPRSAVFALVALFV